MAAAGKTALIVHGGLELHEPEQGARIVANLLEEEGFSVTVTPDYDALGDKAVGELSLIVPLITGGTLARDRMKVLIEAVRDGVGLAGYHHGLATSFREYPDFRYAAGCTWVAHPGDIITYRVDVTRPDDPVMAGIGSFDYTSEQYYLHCDPAVEVLATTVFSGAHHPWRTNVTMPVVYKTTHGKGRVFYSALGHQARELAIPQVRTILRRGLLWAARGR